MLADAEWAVFEAAMAAAGLRGAKPRKDERRTVEAIVWRLDNGGVEGRVRDRRKRAINAQRGG